MDNQENSTLDMLHALADGQLNAQQREEILTRLENDTELRGEMCDIYRVKDLMQTAYPLNEFQQETSATDSFYYGAWAKIASYLLAFVLTFLLGYLVRDSGSYNSEKEHGNLGHSLVNTETQENKVIIFLGSSEPKKFDAALKKAESLAQKYHQSQGKVYVVTSAQGVDLLRLKTSPYKLKIESLTHLYPSLRFVACNNSLYQFKKAGRSIELIDGAEVAPSAVEFVVRHLQQGWRYIAI